MTSEPATLINFAIGQPSDDLLPVELMRRASQDYFLNTQPRDLNYGPGRGDPGFLEALARFLADQYQAPARATDLMVTGGNSQALDLVCTQLTEAGDTVFVEEPTYYLAHQIFADHGLTVVGLPMDGDGLVPDALEAALINHRPRLLYTIPAYHNPGGQTLSAARRDRLIDMARAHDFLIVADEVYQLLHYGAPPPPAFGTRVDCGHVLSLGSFSKILAPGLRLGWIQSSVPIIERLAVNGAIVSGGSVSHYTSLIVRHALTLGLQSSYLAQLQETYRRRVAALDQALHDHLGDVLTWQRPEGGYFFWISLPAGVSARALQARAADFGVGFQPGPRFSCAGDFDDHIRLSFAHYGEDDLREGVRRLARLLGSA